MLSQVAGMYGVKNTWCWNILFLWCTWKEKIQFSYSFQVQQSLIKVMQVQSFVIIYGTNYINKYMAKNLFVLQIH